MGSGQAGHPFRTIADTARFVALLRAQETDRPDALFRDRFARELAIGDDPTLAEHIDELTRRSRFDARAMAVRTRVIDERILRAIRDQGIDTVVNLAAGLDTRPYRMDLPRDLEWVDADLPEVLARKASVLHNVAPRCQLRSLPLDLTFFEARRQMLAGLGATSGRALVLTEGLLMYLHPSQVGALARDLYHCQAVHSWLVDLLSPREAEELRRNSGEELRAAGVEVHFAPEDPQEFFHPLGWQPMRFHSLFLEAYRLHRESPRNRCRRYFRRLVPETWRESWRRSYGVMELRRASL